MDTVNIPLHAVSSKFNEETLNTIVQQAGGVSCDKYEFKTGFKKGDSYLSELYRLKLYGKTKDGKPLEVNSIIKCIPKNVGRRKTFRSADFFRNECNFYNEIMKSIQNFVASKGRTYDEIPKCYAAYTDGENDFVVIEDLGQYGFGTTSRNSGMDYEHCVKCLETLGRFHGLSLTLRDQQPEEFERLTAFVEETYYAPKFKSWYNEFCEIQQGVARDAVSKEYPGEVLAALEKFFAGNLYDKMCELTHTRTKYAVFNHGDCWTPNFLLKYREGAAEPSACRIIDFQLARYSSPALDISFFIYSCTQQDLRESCYDKLLAVYHKAACEMITSLGSNPDVVYPMAGLQSELKQFARFGVGMCIESIPFSLMDDEETADLDSIEGDEMIPITKIWIIKNLKDQAGRRRLADSFVHAKKYGYLE